MIKETDYSNRVLITQKWKEVAEEVGTDDKFSIRKSSLCNYYSTMCIAMEV